MSINSLRGFSVKLYRQTFILARVALVKPRTVRTPVFALTARSAHSDLYQMVKKRTLEARTKLSQQPNSQSQTSYANESPPANSSQVASNTPIRSPSPPPSSSPSPIPPFAKGVKTSAKQSEPPMSQNTKILGANNCNLTRGDSTSCENRPCGDSGKTPTRPAGCPPSGGNDKQPPGGKFPKGLLLLLAALGAGGLLYWLKFSSKDEEKPDPTDELVCKPKAPVEECPILPVSPVQLPKHVPYLLIGGGTAAFSAFRAIKSNDARAKVLMITNEFRKPYMRPPLSKELWYSLKNGEITPDYRFKQWTGAERSLFFEPDEFFIDPLKLMDNPNGGIAVAHGLTVKKIDPIKRKAILNDGSVICYDKCLIATGCSPKNLTILEDASPSVKEKVMTYRTPDDFDRLKHYVDQRKSITIIGNGFVGSELACSLATYASNCKGAKIYQIFPEAGNMSRVLPDYLSKWTTKKVEGQGVCVVPNVSVRAVDRDNSMLRIALSNGNTLLTDVAVVCVGCDPNTGIAYSSGLEVHPELGGFVVNAELEARQNLFVAGDAACFFDPLLGRRRVEHHDHSVISGRLAGENMVGKKKPYSHQSMFWSDLGPEIGYEAIGLIDASLPTVGVFALSPSVERSKSVDNLTENRTQSGESNTIARDINTATMAKVPDQPCDDTYGKGVIFYLKDKKVVGILLWNLFNRIGLARTVINQNKEFSDLNEVAKLFEIHS